MAVSLKERAWVRNLGNCNFTKTPNQSDTQSIGELSLLTRFKLIKVIKYIQNMFFSSEEIFS